MYLKGSKVGNRCLKKKSVCLEKIYIISVEDNTTYLLQEQFVDHWIKNDHMREVWRDPSRSSTPNADRRICEDSRKQQLVHETTVSWYMIKKFKHWCEVRLKGDIKKSSCKYFTALLKIRKKDFSRLKTGMFKDRDFIGFYWKWILKKKKIKWKWIFSILKKIKW